MTNTIENSQPEILGRYLAGALDIEDQMSSHAYGPYLERDLWPAELPAVSFQAIKTNLEILISDTERHTSIIEAIQKRLADQHQNG